MASTIKKQEDGTIILTITIPKADVVKAKEAITEDYVKNAQIPGFRKGKAPKKIVLEKIDQEKVKEEALRKLLPQTYIEAINEHKIKPIINPKVHVHKIEEGSDWEFEAITCEAPVSYTHLTLPTILRV